MRINDPARWAELRRHFEALADCAEDDRAARLRDLARTDPELSAALAALLEEDCAPASPLDGAPRLVREVILDAAEVDAADVPVPRSIGDYDVIRVLGEGAMGVVYLAEQRAPHRPVAIKVLRAGHAARSIVRRFRREAEFLGRLQHPNIALVHAAGMALIVLADGSTSPVERPYFAMEYVEGAPLTVAADRLGLDVPARLKLFLKVCDAVEHAHRRGVIHRDLKPGNILVDARGEPKVLDFGIARAVGPEAGATLHTTTGEVVGTLPYMSPEQFTGAEVDVRSDVYALGVILFELLARRRPLDIDGRSLAEAVRIITDEEPLRLAELDRSLRGDLDTIAAHCLEKSAAHRYLSVADLAEDLRRVLDHRPIAARPPRAFDQVWKFARRNRALVAALALSFVTLVAATVTSTILAIRARTAQQLAEEQLKVAEIENLRSTRSFQFLTSMLSAADPAVSGGRDITVRELLDASTAALEESTEGNQVVGMLARVIGHTYFRLGELETAERLLRRAVELQRLPDEAAVQHEFLAEALVELGDVLRTRGNFREAATVLAEALERFEAQHARSEVGARGEPDGNIAVTWNNLGLVHLQLGDAEAGAAAAQRSVAMERALIALGRGRPVQLATSLVNLGSSQILRGRYAEALRALEEGMELHLVHSGPEAPLTLLAMNNRAVALRGLGRYDESVEILRQVVDVRDRTFPRPHFERASGLGNLANLLHLSGRTLEAEPLLRAALEEHIASLPPGHHSTARSRYLLGTFLVAEGRLEEARKEAVSALADHRATLKPGHFNVVGDLLLLAELDRLEGRFNDAIVYAEEALSSATAAQGEDHPFTIQAALERAVIADLLHPDAESLLSLSDVVERAKRVFGEAHPITGDATLALAEARLRRRDLRGARESLDVTTRIYESAFPSAPWRGALARLLRDATSQSPLEGGLLDDRRQEVVDLVTVFVGPQSTWITRLDDDLRLAEETRLATQ